MSYEGSVLQAISRAVGKRMHEHLPSNAAFSICLGEPDNAAVSVEPAVIWTQPQKDRYRYAAPIYPPPPSGPGQTGDVVFDRFLRVEVIVRAPGSEARLLALSDALMAALDYELGAEGSEGENWVIYGDSDGGGSGTNDGAWEERFEMGIKYAVIRAKYAPSGNPFAVDVASSEDVPEGGIYAEGPAQGENQELVQ